MILLSSNYKLLFSKIALKQFEYLDKTLQIRIKKSLAFLVKNPFEKQSGADIKYLTGFDDPKLYRLRVGDYRIIYTVETKNIKITKIGKRGNVYFFLD